MSDKKIINESAQPTYIEHRSAEPVSYNNPINNVGGSAQPISNGSNSAQPPAPVNNKSK